MESENTSNSSFRDHCPSSSSSSPPTSPRPSQLYLPQTLLTNGLRNFSFFLTLSQFYHTIDQHNFWLRFIAFKKITLKHQPYVIREARVNILKIIVTRMKMKSELSSIYSKRKIINIWRNKIRICRMIELNNGENILKSLERIIDTRTLKREFTVIYQLSLKMPEQASKYIVLREEQHQLSRCIALKTLKNIFIKRIGNAMWKLLIYKHLEDKVGTMRNSEPRTLSKETYKPKRNEKQRDKKWNDKDGNILMMIISCERILFRRRLSYGGELMTTLRRFRSEKESKETHKLSQNALKHVLYLVARTTLNGQGRSLTDNISEHSNSRLGHTLSAEETTKLNSVLRISRKSYTTYKQHYIFRWRKAVHEIRLELKQTIEELELIKLKFIDEL